MSEKFKKKLFYNDDDKSLDQIYKIIEHLNKNISEQSKKENSFYNYDNKSLEYLEKNIIEYLEKHKEDSYWYFNSEIHLEENLPNELKKISEKENKGRNDKIIGIKFDINENKKLCIQWISNEHQYHDCAYSMEDAVKDNIFQRLELFNEQRNILIFMIKNIKNMLKQKRNYFNILLQLVILTEILINLNSNFDNIQGQHSNNYQNQLNQINEENLSFVQKEFYQFRCDIVHMNLDISNYQIKNTNKRNIENKSFLCKTTDKNYYDSDKEFEKFLEEIRTHFKLKKNLEENNKYNLIKKENSEEFNIQKQRSDLKLLIKKYSFNILEIKKHFEIIIGIYNDYNKNYILDVTKINNNNELSDEQIIKKSQEYLYGRRSKSKKIDLVELLKEKIKFDEINLKAMNKILKDEINKNGEKIKSIIQEIKKNKKEIETIIGKIVYYSNKNKINNENIYNKFQEYGEINQKIKKIYEATQLQELFLKCKEETKKDKESDELKNFFLNLDIDVFKQIIFNNTAIINKYRQDIEKQKKLLNDGQSKTDKKQIKNLIEWLIEEYFNSIKDKNKEDIIQKFYTLIEKSILENFNKTKEKIKDVLPNYKSIIHNKENEFLDEELLKKCKIDNEIISIILELNKKQEKNSIKRNTLKEFIEKLEIQSINTKEWFSIKYKHFETSLERIINNGSNNYDKNDDKKTLGTKIEAIKFYFENGYIESKYLENIYNKFQNKKLKLYENFSLQKFFITFEEMEKEKCFNKIAQKIYNDLMIFSTCESVDGIKKRINKIYNQYNKNNDINGRKLKIKNVLDEKFKKFNKIHDKILSLKVNVKNTSATEKTTKENIENFVNEYFKIISFLELFKIKIPKRNVLINIDEIFGFFYDYLFIKKDKNNNSWFEANIQKILKYKLNM